MISYRSLRRCANQAIGDGCRIGFMTIPRSQLIDRENGGLHHIVTRCVRRAWLCGRDPLTGRDYSHRKQWIEERILKLAKFFAVRVHAYGIMSNHYHIQLEYCPREVRCLTSEEVVRRWLSAYPPSREAHLEARVAALLEDPDRVELLRQRLGDLSWYMRCLNWNIARRANLEDGCTGKFWESRFYSSRPLESPEALEACMTYVDLNPRRAGAVREVAGEGACTSLRRRVEEALRDKSKMDLPLAPLTISKDGVVSTENRTRLLKTLRSYLTHVELVAQRDDMQKGHSLHQRQAVQSKSLSMGFLAAFAKFDRRWGRIEGTGDIVLPGHRLQEHSVA